MKIIKILPFAYMLVSGVLVQAQTSDTLYTFKEKIVCTVKEVSLDVIKYSYPGEEVVNVLPIRQVHKIVYRSGRVQNVSATPLLKNVRYVADWQNVLVTKNETDVSGLKKFNEITTIAWYGSLQNTRDRAIHHLMMIAAMEGCKAIFKTFEEEEFRERAVEAMVSGIPYTDSLPSLNQLKARIGIKTKFKVLGKYILSGSGLTKEEAYSHFVITETLEKNGITYLYGDIGVHSGYFKLVYVGPDYFVVYFKGEPRLFNFVVSY